jgi:F-type H+-transporting ATPase subunit gamma
METAESLKRKITVTRELRSVVRTMKALAAVSIRQFEKAERALQDYSMTVDLGLHIVLRGRNIEVREPSGGPWGAVVFGSDQGMCGQFNAQIAAYFDNTVRRETGGRDAVRIAALGVRGAAHLMLKGYRLEWTSGMPDAVSRINSAVQRLAVDIEDWQDKEGVWRIRIFHNRQRGGASFAPVAVDLIPVSAGWLRDIRQRSWKTKVLPVYTMEFGSIFSALVRHHLLVTLYRSFAESLAAENAARLASMQAAEHNVEEQLKELQLAFHQERQTAITTELLDVIAGFESVQ